MRGRRPLLALGLILALVGPAAARPWSWLGVRIRDLSEQEMDAISARHGIREGFGVFVVEVLEDTPAARAGLRSGDVVVAFEGRPVTETRLLQRLIAAAPAGAQTRLTVLRPEGRRRVAVRLVAMPPAVAGDRVAAEFGFAIREPAAQPELGGGRSGTAAPEIAVVARGGPAERTGLEVGDVILTVGDRAVLTADEAREALAAAGPDRSLRLTVRRGERRLSLTLAAP